LNNVRRETSRTFRNRKREYRKENINEHETNSTNKNITGLYRGINEFKKGYKLRNNIIKDDNDDLLGDFHSVLNRWKNYFCQLLNVHGINYVRQTEMHADETLEPEPSSFGV
jgi:hypothetical protein